MEYFLIVSAVLISTISSCISVHYPSHASYPKYDVEEINSKHQPIYQKTSLSSNSIYDQNQLNQHALNNVNQLINNHQYPTALQQIYSPSRLLQNTNPFPYTQPQNFGLSTQQQFYPSPLGTLYSPAPEVSQFHFNGNGINYSF